MNKVIDAYWKTKRVYELAVNGDIQDERTRLIRSSLTPDMMYEMKELVEGCENIGIHLLRREDAN